VDRRPKAPEVLDNCSEVLDAEVIDHSGREASAIVVCPERVWRLFPAEDQAHTFVDLPNPARWGTVTRTGASSADVVSLLYAIEFDGLWQLELRQVQPNGLGLRFINGQLPPELRLDQTPDQARLPIWSNIQAGGPYIQLRDDGPPRALVQNSSGRSAWQPLLTPGEDRIEFSVGRARVVTTRERDDGTTDFWVVDVGRSRLLNLWATAPTFTEPTADLRWLMTRAALYEDFLVVFLPGNAPNELQVITRRATCLNN
jgi:hypothetical protein